MTRMLPLMTLLAAVAAFSMAACEMSESCDPATDPNCIPADSGGGDTTADTGGDSGGGFQTYHYILIEDEDQNASGDRPGADIDGVELVRNGQSVFLSQIHESGFGGEQPSGANANVNNARGEPEDQCQGEDPGDWDPTTFVSLGGEGGFLVGSFTGLAPIETGNTITVHACAGPQSETWTLSVGVGTSANDPNFFEIISNGVAVVDVTVPNLPQVPEN